MQPHILRLRSLILLVFLAATGDVEASEFCGSGSLGGCGERAADHIVSTSSNKDAAAVPVPSTGERLSSPDATPSVPPLCAASAAPEAADCADVLGSAGGSRSLQGGHLDASLSTTTRSVGASNNANSIGEGQVGALASDIEAQGPSQASQQQQQQPDEEPRGAPANPSDADVASSTVQSASAEPQAAVPRDVGLQGSAGSPDPPAVIAGSVECAARAEGQDSPSMPAAPQPQPSARQLSQQQSVEPPPQAQSAHPPPPPPPQPSDALQAAATPVGATTAPTPSAPPQPPQPPSAPSAPEQRKRSSHTAIPKPDDFVLSIPTPDLSLSMLGPDSGGVVGAQAAAQLGLAAFTGEDVLGEAFLGAFVGDADARMATGEGAPGVASGLDAGMGAGGSGAAASGAGAAAPGQLLDSDYEEEEGRKINLAAASDGASIVAANKEAKRPERLIDGDDDSYMKNACSASKWVIVELSQLGRVDKIKLTMKEMYSSRVRDFVVKGRQSHPKKDGLADYSKGLESEGWQLLGLFHAENRKGSQVFRLPRKARVRYLLLQVLSHYGTEEMCALNSMEVRGVTAAQELEAALSRPLNAHPPPPAAAAAAAAAPASVGAAAATPVRGASAAAAAAAAQHKAANGNGGSLPPPSPEAAALGGQAGKQAGAPAAAPNGASTSTTGSANPPAQDAGQIPGTQQQPQHQEGVSSGGQGLGAHEGGEAVAAVREGGGSTEAAAGPQTGMAEGVQAQEAAAIGQGNAAAGAQGSQGESCNATSSGYGNGTGSSANSSSSAAPAPQGEGAPGQANPSRPPVGSGSLQEAAAGAAQPEAQDRPGRLGAVEAAAGGTDAPAAGASSSGAAQADAKGHGDAAAAEEAGGCEGPKASQVSGPAAEAPSTVSGGAATPQPSATLGPTAGAANGAAGAADAESPAAQPQVQQCSQQPAAGTPTTEVSGASPNGLDGLEGAGDSKADRPAGAGSGPGPSLAESCVASEAPTTPAPGTARPGSAIAGSAHAGSAAKVCQVGAAPPASAAPNTSSLNAGGAGAPMAPEDNRTAVDTSQAPPTAGSDAAEALVVSSGAGQPADTSARGAGTGGLEPQGAGSSGVPLVNSQDGATEAERQSSCGGGPSSQPTAINGVAAGPATDADVSVPNVPATTGSAAQAGAAAPSAAAASTSTSAGAAQAAVGTNVASASAAAGAPVQAAGAASEQPQPQVQAQQSAAAAPSVAVTVGGSNPASSGADTPASPPNPTAASPAPTGNGAAAATPTHTAGAGSLPQPTPLASTPQEDWFIPPVQGPTAAAAAAAAAGASAAAAPAAAPATAGVPPPVPSLDSILSMLEGGAASKPRVAGNLFDVIKQEMMMLKLNQTRLWQYIHALVEALNARHAELEADALAMEDKMALLDAQAALTVQAVARAREAPLAPIAALTTRVAELEERAARAEALGAVVLLYSSTILAAAAMAGLTTGGSRVVKWLMALLGVANGVAGLALHGNLLQGGLAMYGKTAAVNAAQLFAQASDVLRWRR